MAEKFIPSNKPVDIMEVISIRVAREKLEKLNELSGKYNISRNEFINECIDYALRNMDENEKK